MGFVPLPPLPVRRDKSGRPLFSLSYMRREDDTGPYCPECDSSQVWPWGLLGKLIRATPKGCIQPECANYWRRPRAPEASAIADEVARTESSELPGGRE